MKLDPNQVLKNAAIRLTHLEDYDDRLVGLIETYASMMDISVADAFKATVKEIAQ